MEAFRSHRGIVAPLNRINVDTDQVIPKQFLKRIERTGYGEFLFHDWRFKPDGQPDPNFVLNRPEYQCASILLARRNFGCGSSREHAPWALQGYGFRAMVAPSFADIFYNNSLKNGLLPVTLTEKEVDGLFRRVAQQHGYELDIDLEELSVRGTDGFSATFHVDPFRRRMLLEGLDEIALTLNQEQHIRVYEEQHWPFKHQPRQDGSRRDSGHLLGEGADHA